MERATFALIALLACGRLSHATYPDDQQPRMVISNPLDLKGSAVFTGKKTNSDNRAILDVQDARFVNGSLLLGTRNSVYVVSRESLQGSGQSIFYDQAVWWFRQNDTNCEQKTSSTITCQNYIRVVAPLSPSLLLLCGTNAGQSVCREYKWTGKRIDDKTFFSTSAALVHRLPKDDLSSLVYRVLGNEIFMATRADFNRADSAVSRTAVRNGRAYARSPKLVHNNAASPSLRTDRQALNDARFVGMVEVGSKMLVFFREVADEASKKGLETNVFSRVAQVCKSDAGGTYQYLNQKWTSFFKARLNCSIPGDRPFYFNEIQAVTDLVNVSGQQVVFATMTTPPNSITGSAVCAFSLSDIQYAFAGGFWERNRSTFCYNSRPAISPHPASCKTRKNSTLLRFAKLHPILSRSVSSLGGSPLFMTTQSRSRFTAIAVETVETRGNSLAIMYIGTDEGKILKVTSSNLTSGDAVLSEEWFAFRTDSCSPPPSTARGRSGAFDDPRAGPNPDVKHVRKILLQPGSEFLLVTFRHCVVKIPKQTCFLHPCESSCATSGNPYCVWSNGKCRPMSRDDLANQKVILSSADGGHKPCRSGDGSRTPGSAGGSDLTRQGSEATAQPPSCFQSSNFALTLVVGILTTFSLVLLIFLVMVLCRGRRHNLHLPIGSPSCMKEEPSPIAVANQSAIKGEGTGYPRSKRTQAPRVSIAPSTHPAVDEDLLTSSALEAAASPSNGVHVVQNLQNEAANSGEDTTWSDDWLESERSSPDGNPGRLPAPPTAEQLQSNSNNNRAVGVAHPMSHRPGKLSQVVPPTFVSKQSKIKLGSQKDYGSLSQTRSSDHHATEGDFTQHSRIVTNPNYLPVSPFTPRTPADAKPRVDPLGSPLAATFKTFSSPTEERCDSNDSSFPPPPPCALSPSSRDTEDATTLPVSTSWYPSPPGDEELNPIGSPPSAFPVLISSDPVITEKTPLNGSAKPFVPSSKAMSSSASGDSSTSGFVSSSPKSSFKEKSLSSRKGLIVAKGILSAQSYAPLKKKSKKKKDAKSRVVERYSVAERQDAAGEGNWSTQADAGDDTFEDESSEESGGIPQISPEFVVSSEEEESPNHFSPNQDDASTPKAEDGKSKSKKPINLFKGRRSKKWKKDRNQGIRITDEDTFMSPAYDEEPFVPTVVGWEEIEYTSPAGIHGEGMTSFRTDQGCDERRAYDDSYVEMRGGTGPGQDCAFYTMRPKGRMRRRMPKMRNTDREWALTNNPLPVPTPAVPDTP